MSNKIPDLPQGWSGLKNIGVDSGDGNPLSRSDCAVLKLTASYARMSMPQHGHADRGNSDAEFHLLPLRSFYGTHVTMSGQKVQ